MKEFKGKPGPWHWEGRVLCNDAHIVGGDGWTFNDADKILIAAAPELLEALQQCIPHLREQSKKDGHAFGTLQLVNRIIDKALGEKK